MKKRIPKRIERIAGISNELVSSQILWMIKMLPDFNYSNGQQHLFKGYTWCYDGRWSSLLQYQHYDHKSCGWSLLSESKLHYAFIWWLRYCCRSVFTLFPWVLPTRLFPSLAFRSNTYGLVWYYWSYCWWRSVGKEMLLIIFLVVGRTLWFR